MEVYCDASVTSKGIGIGVYCKTLEKQHSILLPISTKEVHMAELLAVMEAKRLYPEATTFYTDNQGIIGVIDHIKWVPRKQNTIADHLSKVAHKPYQSVSEDRVITDICKTIRQNYTFEQRYNLWRKLVQNDYDQIVVNAMTNNYTLHKDVHRYVSKNFIELVISTYKRADNINDSVKEIFRNYNKGNYKTLSDTKIVKILQQVQK